ncbi:hypothetical protein COCCADRAFT_41596 [Bipolaris zeicola 26-R-13]|uniref:Uncharacterized protein n=1 Tax=Cochliobolus carbonum (strain 26-R-13) TaxID=930089 RepID=W6XQ97_COCC2|nr:uncharacterized protein COCCADRAFT_41596 [Bipolaris zeicola 26-R-13]EUC27758.1 hypothetical protein COCCADRAFT_41596 [Bipolaris zeicola 26-R-13]
MRGTTYTSIETLSALDGGVAKTSQVRPYLRWYGHQDWMPPRGKRGDPPVLVANLPSIGGTVGVAASQAESLAPPSPSPYHGGSMRMPAGRSSLEHGKLLHATKV